MGILSPPAILTALSRSGMPPPARKSSPTMVTQMPSLLWRGRLMAKPSPPPAMTAPSRNGTSPPANTSSHLVVPHPHEERPLHGIRSPGHRMANVLLPEEMAMSRYGMLPTEE